jgi:hypothetical protein
MAIRHIREAFDQEADGVAVSLSAILEYVEGTKQRLTIKASIAATNEIRFLMSNVHGMESEPNEEGRKLARKLKADLASAAATPGAGAPVAPDSVTSSPPPGDANAARAAVPVTVISVISAAAPAVAASDPPPAGANPFM